jgi:hypothetical protein
VNCLSDEYKPDIITGNWKVIKGSSYRVKLVKREEETKQEVESEPMIELPESDDECSISIDENEYKEVNTIPTRYFNQENKSVRCFNCNQVGHMSYDCPNEQVGR